MTTVKVLGVGCSICRETVQLIEEVAQAMGADVTVVMAVELGDMIAYGVMSTPGVVIDGTVVHMGGVPMRSRVEGWFR